MYLYGMNFGKVALINVILNCVLLLRAVTGLF